MKLLVTGGTGFIGQALCPALARQGHSLIVLTRNSSRRPPASGITFSSWETGACQRAMETCDGVVNLAGDALVGKRWSGAQKRLIRESRLESTRRLVSTIAVLEKRPAVLISASAIGYYGSHGDEPLTEADPPGRGFLAQLCQDWEAEAQRAERLGMRVVRLRIGLVLGPGGGALAKLVPPFRCWLGGPLGSGRQWVSWIHQDDVVGLIGWALAQPQVQGAVNATAPEAATMRELCRTLGQVLRRPSWMLVPSAALRLLLGEMADVLLTGQRVLPQAALRHGFTFRHPRLQQALAACVA
jgi:uncharacterized protein (TIGR01777 family)